MQRRVRVGNGAHPTVHVISGTDPKTMQTLGNSRPEFLDNFNPKTNEFGVLGPTPNHGWDDISQRLKNRGSILTLTDVNLSRSINDVIPRSCDTGCPQGSHLRLRPKVSSEGTTRIYSYDICSNPRISVLPTSDGERSLVTSLLAMTPNLARAIRIRQQDTSDHGFSEEEDENGMTVCALEAIEELSSGPDGVPYGCDVVCDGVTSGDSTPSAASKAWSDAWQEAVGQSEAAAAGVDM